MNAMDFIGWWNWIFVAPFILGALMVALSVFGSGGQNNHGGSGHVHMGVDRGIAGSDGDVDGDDEFLGELLEILHLQGVPPLTILQNLLLWWGICGWTANRALGQHGAAMISISLPIACVGALFLTFTTSRFLAKLAPGESSSAARSQELEGRSGEATARITVNGGEAFVRDSSGTLHQIAVRIGPDEEPIARGRQVLVLAYDEKDGRYRVRLWHDV